MTTIAVIGIRGFPGVQGGVEIHSENLYPIMPDVHIRVYRRKPYLTQQSLVSYPNIEYIDLPSTRIKGFEAVFHTFLCVLHIIFHRPHLVHVHNIGPGMFAPLLRLFGLKTVMTYHSPNYEHKKWGLIARCILHMSEFLSLTFVNRIIFVNKFQMEKYSKRVLNKSVYIPNGINRCIPSTSTSFLNEIGVERHGYVLAVGRITPEKGFEHLIRAVNASAAVKHLVIAGACDHDSQYLKTLKQLDINHKTIFTGFTFGENLNQLYSHARLYVLSSVNEGFPLVLLEAMNYSLPIVASDLPATHLIDLPADSYVQKANPEALAEKISNSLNKPFAPVNYNLTPFNWQTIATQTLNLFKSI
ncbi:MAG: glycosyltransferase family 4 protein [Muribaculaceae bacterium]